MGDEAITIDFGNIVDERINDRVLQLFDELHRNPLPGMTEALPAYSSITIYYNVQELKKKNVQSTACLIMRTAIEKWLTGFLYNEEKNKSLINIPACYDPEYGIDLQTMTSQKGLSVEDIIQLHTSKIYRVYMIGFLPGFPYMGIIDGKLKMPRKNKPEMVSAGSIGIAGLQTGIYPFDSPGGWQVIGRTPLRLFDKENDDPVFLKPGDRIQFYSISKDEFESFKNRNS